ncbi:MAG: tripartite tricarboxylate transporter substrate-binding protein [Xanthobacteraceae bacterium]
MTALARLCALALAIVAAAGTTARADDRYPSRVITIVVPLTPGTAIDIQARLYADGLAKRFGYQAVVVNRAGAGTLIGAETVANSSPDGYTVLLTNSAHAILGAMNRNLPFDPIADFAGICMVAQAPTVIAVPPSLGVHNLQEFVALAKAKPGTINYGSAGIGTATHIAGAYFAYKTGTELVHVPYTVSQTILTDMLSGNIQATFAPEAFVLPLLQDGRLLALAVADDAPVTEPVKIPTARSAGVDYVNATWYGFLAPAKTPRAVLATLHDAIVEVGKDPDIQTKIRQQGFAPANIGLHDFDAHIRADMARLAPILAKLGQSH